MNYRFEIGTNVRSEAIKVLGVDLYTTRFNIKEQLKIRRASNLLQNTPEGEEQTPLEKEIEVFVEFMHERLVNIEDKPKMTPELIQKLDADVILASF